MVDLERARGALESDQDERRVQRMWRNVEAKRADRPRRAHVRPLAFGFAAIALVAAALVVRVAVTREVPSPHAALPGRLVADGEATRIALPDGSEIALDVGAHVDVIERRPRNVELALRRGRVDFDVKGTDTSTWRVDCGAVEIAFVGSAFSITRGDADVSLEVRRGAVVARGEGVPDRVQRIGAGSSLRVPLSLHERARAPEDDALEAASLETPAAPQLEPSDVEPSPSAEPPMSWRRAALAGRSRDAFTALGVEGIARETRTLTEPDDLLMLADVARLSGHASQAVAPLERIVLLHAGDPRAAIASYTLGQLHLDRLGRPADAARAYARALDLGLPRSMRELAMARRVEALGRAHGAVAEAASVYLAQFPEGRYRAEVERWLSP